MKDNMSSIRLFLLAVALVLASVLATAAVSYAIINGQPDGGWHPYVGRPTTEWTFARGQPSLHIYS